jgi:hypothetical protein
VAKNLATNYRFKWTVRALKNLKYDMEANGSPEQKQAARQAPSYLCECLMYNAPAFAGDSPREQLRNAIASEVAVPFYAAMDAGAGQQLPAPGVGIR